MATATFNSAKGRPYEITGWPKVLLDYRNSRNFTFLQLHEIGEGLRRRVDVSAYANPSLDHHQMYALRIGLQNGLPVADLAQPHISWMDMLSVLEDRGDGLVYVAGGERIKRMAMPSIDELVSALLQEPVAQTPQEQSVNFQEVYESLPEGMRAYVAELMGKDGAHDASIDADIITAKTAIAERASSKPAHLPELS